MSSLRSTIRLTLRIALLTGLAALPACSQAASNQTIVTPSSGRGLAAFQSDDELRAFLRLAGERRSREMEAYDMAPMAAPAPVAAEAAPSADSGTSQGITNNQEAGVDEGGIVKNWRDYLVILRRGRLFTVSVANGAMRPVAAINAFPPGVSGQGDWYDEMLISGDRVIVIGYSYARGGTEVNRFRISPDGRLTFEDAYHLRSNDYYSSRNYASRLIGDRLIYYTPLYVGSGRGEDPLDALPGLRKWGPAASQGAFRRIADARRVFVIPSLKDREDVSLDALHSVIDCDLTAAEMECSATAVLGPASRSFYVSSGAVYLATADFPRGGGNDRPAQSYLYRIPFEAGGIPTAIGTRGMPIDQFSFREDRSAGRIDILVQALGRGDAMWGPEQAGGSPLALLQLPLDQLGDGSGQAEANRYRPLPALGANSYDLHNRFVGDYLLYGAGGSGSGPDRNGGGIVAISVSGGDAVTLPLPHGVERIEAMGGDALAIGGMGDALGFTAIHLGRSGPSVGERYVQRAAAQGESRSHGFFYRPDSGSGGASGTIGLPVMRPVEPLHRRFFGSAASMLFLRRDAGGFNPSGELVSRPDTASDDNCQASCVDWYGNARPIFLGDRIFALLGYELVEGRLSNGRISETGRTSFALRGAVTAKPD